MRLDFNGMDMLSAWRNHRQIVEAVSYTHLFEIASTKGFGAKRIWAIAER